MLSHTTSRPRIIQRRNKNRSISTRRNIFAVDIAAFLCLPFALVSHATAFTTATLTPRRTTTAAADHHHYMHTSRSVTTAVSAASVGSSSRFFSSTTGACTRTRTRNSALFGIGVLIKKAKQAELRKYVQEEGVEESVRVLYERIIHQSSQSASSASALHADDRDQLPRVVPGPLQQALTKRKGTISIIAEYKRTTMIHNDNHKSNSMNNNNVYDPQRLSPLFREFGCSGIAVLADAQRGGGCTYADLQTFVQEQKRAHNDVPGSVLIINSDVIVDPLQIARSAAYGAAAVLLDMNVLVTNDDNDHDGEVGKDSLQLLSSLLRACQAVELEAIVSVRTAQQAQIAVNMGVRILCVIGDGVHGKMAVVQNLIRPDGEEDVCKIAYIQASNDQQFQEIEEAWAMRDQGFQSVWVSDVLYKGGADAIEHPGAIIRSMKSKSSLKWASPKAYSGKGEGAREYLGDILM